MTDHFLMAEKLLADTAELDPTLPFVQHKVTRAGVHAQLATVQAFLGDSCECGENDRDEKLVAFLRQVTLTPKEIFL